ncbi:hypothetical protein MSAN_01715100 [Mycena sanguinolenta]|uniref:Uncharacterized protein n=1 Tax=Mycena sanguinolenta TaxID=230812 RepID=A0A8H7CV83_9AGAR|nr:hypothetical protein MSAN_01715100 [Mycena sanguinolenta]
MEAVSASIDALKKAAVGSKDKSVKAAAAELGQILTLLGSSSSPQKRAKLKTIFADKLYALYPAFLRQMCQFCANVLQAIYHEKKAVVSSVLDFLDQNQKDSNNKSNKDIVADAFYAVFLRHVLSSKAHGRLEEPKSDLQCRFPWIYARLYLTMFKEFFVLDSLVALVGVLLPARESAVKRTQFVDAIFKPELFPASAEIKELIATAAGADWDPIATGIINCFAKTDLSCPQPFVVNGFRTDTSAPVLKMVDPLYVDNHGLYTNVEKDGTYQVPFSTIERVKIGVPGTPWTPVSIQLSAEPLIGPVSEIVTAKKKCTMQFQLKNKDAGRFLQALKARGLNKLISDTKVSKIPEGVSLTFDSGARKPAQTREEKVTKIAQVWDSGVESGRPTSPLVPNPYETPGLKHDSSSTNSDLAEPCSQHDAMDGDELTDVSDAEGKATSKAKPPATKMTTPPRRVRVAEDSDDEQRAPIKPRPRKSAMKNRMIESDEEGEMEGDEIPSSSFSNGKDQDFEPTQPVTEKSTGKELSLSEDEMEIDTTEGKPLATTKEPVAAGITTKKRSTGKADPIQVKTEIASKPAKLESKNGPKRLKADEEEASDGENEDEPSRPAKRLRGQIAAAEEPEPAPAHRASAAVFGTVTHAPVKKRYGGKKGRTSSPVPDSIAGDTDMNIDYDELPTAPSPLPSPIVKAEKKAKQQPKTVSDVNDARKGRVAAMRGKGGQKPAAKAPPKATKAAGKTKAKAPVLDASDDVECDDDVKPPRRSTRTNAAPKAEESTIETKVPKPKPKTKPEKPRKAPWEDMHLQKKEDVAMADDPLPQNDDVAMQDELQTGSDESPRILRSAQAYERTPDMGHPATTFGRGLYKHETEEREHDYKRSRSPMQEIIEKIQEIGAVIVENITHRFDHVRKDVRIGRDTILRGATANLEVMCAESESHFNVLVDLEEEYAAFHRKIISGMDNMQKNAELFSDTLGDVVQHHDRRSLSKKMPASLFTLPSTLRKPVVLL